MKFICVICFLVLTNAVSGQVLTDSSFVDEPAKKSTFFSVLKNTSSVTAPVVMLGYGYLATKNTLLKSINLTVRHEVLEKRRTISSNVDDALQYLPAQAVFALNFAGFKSKNNFVDRVALYGLSHMIMRASIDNLKKQHLQLRPDGSDWGSFPSSHTATAFSAAEFMRLEYKDESPFYTIAAYGVAATTGALRVYHNKHWLSDVIAGASVGIVSTNLSYFVYPKVKKVLTKAVGLNTTSKLNIGPSYQFNTPGISLSFNP